MSCEFIRVIARVKPTQGQRFLEIDNNTILVPGCQGKPPIEFPLDHALDGHVLQEEVYNFVGRRIVEGCLEGYNGTIFAYGQTGSGKTHTMLGPSQVQNFFMDHTLKGLIPRAGEHLFECLEAKKREAGDQFVFNVECSFVELYNEVFYDLLDENHRQLQLRCDNKAVQLQDVTRENVPSMVDLMRLVQLGWEKRCTAETAMNMESSRSHGIFMIQVSMEHRKGGLINRNSATINLIDLAGSERQSQTHTAGVRLKEASNINQSLSVLGRVIKALSNGKNEHVAYRDSKLTLLLRDSLGGSSRTSVIVNLHPENKYCSESLSTLRFAQACKKVKNHALANREIAGDTIQALQDEITRLTEALDEAKAKKVEEYEQKLAEAEAANSTLRENLVLTHQELAQKSNLLDLRSIQLRISPDVQDREEEMLAAVNKRFADAISCTENLEQMDKLALNQQLQAARFEVEELQKTNNDLEKKIKEVQANVEAQLGHSIISSPLRDVTADLGNMSMMTPKDRKLRRRTRYTLSSQVSVLEQHRKNPTQHLWGDEVVEAENKEKVGHVSDLEKQIFDQEVEIMNLRTMLDQEKESRAKLENLVTEKMEALEEERANFHLKENALTRELDELANQLAQRSTQLTKTSEQNSALLTDLTDKQQKIVDLEREINQLSNEKSDLEFDFQRSKDDLQAQLTLQQEQVDLKVTQLMEEHKQHLASKDVAMVDMVANLRAPLEADIARKNKEITDLSKRVEIQEDILKKMKDKVYKLQEEHQATVQELKEVQEDYESVQVSLENVNREKTEAFARFEQTIQEKTEELEGLTTKCEEQQKEIDELYEKISKKNDELKLQIQLNQENIQEIMTEKEILSQENDSLRRQLNMAKKTKDDQMAVKLAEFKQIFSQTESKLSTITKEKAEVDEELSKTREQCQNLVHQLEDSRKALDENLDKLAIKEEENHQLVKQTKIMEEHLANNNASLSDVLGHNNKKQKVKIVEQYRNEIFDLKKENDTLKARVSKLETDKLKCKLETDKLKTPVEGPHKPVTRSRRPQ